MTTSNRVPWPLRSGCCGCGFFHLYMKLKLNGEEKEISEGLSVAGLLEQLQIRQARVVVERNREIVPRDAYGAIFLAEGDTLEIVHFVGGG